MLGSRRSSSQPVLDDALPRIYGLLRPGGHIVFGVAFSDETDPLAAATDDLMTVRSGGSVIDLGNAIGRLGRAGFEDVREIDRTWNPPRRFVVGRRA